MRRACRITACLLLATAATPASAAPWDLVNDRILGDPAFLPLAGEVEGSFGYSYEAMTYDYDEGSPPESIDRSYDTFLPSLSYGITDRVSASVELPFGNERTDGSFTSYGFVYGPGGGKPAFVDVRRRFSQRAIGAENPTFRLNWRAIEQGSGPSNLDLAAFYLPNIFQARSSDGQTGTIASGGQSGGIEASVSREMQALTLRAYVELELVGLQHVNADPVSQSIYYGGHAFYAAGVQSQTRVAPWLAVNAGVQAQISAAFDQTTVTHFASFPPQSSSARLIPGGEIAPYVGVVIPLFGGRAAGELTYQHSFIGDERRRGPYGSNEYFGQGSNIYTARLLFRFQAL